MLKTVVILPTGNEIADGTVYDSSSLAIMEILLQSFPASKIVRLAPAADEEKAITLALLAALQEAPELLFTIGGTGGGRKYVEELAPDYTAASLATLLDNAEEVNIFGSNGHLWARIVAGAYGNTRIVGLPGPHAEALAAAKAAVAVVMDNGDNRLLAEAVSKAVQRQYINR